VSRGVRVQTGRWVVAGSETAGEWALNLPVHHT
jgi:hypothetical protein